MSTASQNNKLAKSLGYVFLWAGLLFIFDAFVFSQGFVSALVLIWMLFVSLPRSFTFTKDPEFRKYLMWRSVIYIAAALFVFAFIIGNNLIAAQRAEVVIAAVNAYKAKYSHYPESLEELAPEFVENVPAAKYTISGNKFQYVASKDAHGLFYVTMPPFGRKYYSFERGVWTRVD